MRYLQVFGLVALFSSAAPLTIPDLAQCSSLMQLEWKRVGPKKDNGDTHDEEHAPMRGGLLQCIPVAASETVSAIVQNLSLKGTVQAFAPAFALCSFWCGCCVAFCFATRSRSSSHFSGLEAFRKQQQQQEEEQQRRRAIVVSGLVNQVPRQSEQVPLVKAAQPEQVPLVKAGAEPLRPPNIPRAPEHHMNMSDDDKEEDTDDIGTMVISPEYYSDLVRQLQIESKGREELQQSIADLEKQNQKEKAELESQIEALKQEKAEAEEVAAAELQELRREFEVTETSYREQVRDVQLNLEIVSRQTSKDYTVDSSTMADRERSSSSQAPWSYNS